MCVGGLRCRCVGKEVDKKNKKSCGASTAGRRTIKNRSLGFAVGKPLLYIRQMKNLPHEIILALSKSYYTEKPKIELNYLFKSFNTSSTDKVRVTQIKEILNILESKNYLKWNPAFKLQNSDKYLSDGGFDTDFKSNLGSGAKDAANKLDEIKFMAILTPLGVDYAIDIERKRVEQRNNNLAIWIAASAFFLSAIGLFREIIQDKQKQDKVLILKKKLKEAGNSMQNLQNRIDYLSLQMDSVKTVLKDSLLKP